MASTSQHEDVKLKIGGNMMHVPPSAADIVSISVSRTFSEMVNDVS